MFLEKVPAEKWGGCRLWSSTFHHSGSCTKSIRQASTFSCKFSSFSGRIASKPCGAALALPEMIPPHLTLTCSWMRLHVHIVSCNKKISLNWNFISLRTSDWPSWCIAAQFTSVHFHWYKTYGSSQDFIWLIQKHQRAIFNAGAELLTSCYINLFSFHSPYLLLPQTPFWIYFVNIALVCRSAWVTCFVSLIG